MWTMIPSLLELSQPLGAAFTDASFRTHCQFLLAWVMCLGDHNVYRVATTANLDRDLPRSQRHCFDRFYNDFLPLRLGPRRPGPRVRRAGGHLPGPLWPPYLGGR